MTNFEPLAVADALHRASAAGDVAALRELYEPDAVVWHNTDGIDVPIERSMRTLSWLRRTVPDLRLEDVRVDPTPFGFVLRWTMTGSAPGGGFCMPSCLVVELSAEGKIARLSEYMDSAQVAVLLGTDSNPHEVR